MNIVTFTNNSAITIYFFFCLYHFVIYWGRKSSYKELYNIYFSIFSLSFGIFILFETLKNESYSIFIYLPTLELITLFFIFYFGCMFVSEVINSPRKILNKIFIITFISLSIAALLSIINILNRDLYLKYFYKIVMIFVMIALFAPILFLTYWIIKNKIYKEKFMIYLYVGAVIQTLWTPFYKGFQALDIITNLGKLYLPHAIALFFYALSIANRFNKEFHELNRKTKQLEDLTNTLEQKVKEKTAELKQATEEKINFFINSTHEYKTPLTIIENYLKLHIKNNGITQELNHVKYNVEKLKQNANNLIDFEKLERSQVFYNHDTVTGLSDLLNTKIDMFDKIAENKKIKITGNIEDNIYTKIDMSAMDRIINNLLDNAVKYTGKDGRIDISLKEGNKKINLTVSDTGNGISKEQLENIFKPYHQLSHKKRNIQGIGMGLSIVKKILDGVNGEIKVESELNKGSAFTIILKKSEKKVTGKIRKKELIKPQAVIKVDLLEEKYDKDKNTVLIVEDDLEIIQLLQKSFYDVYNIYYGINGRDALDKINTMPVKPDIIISDIMMDEMDGYEFRKELLKDPGYKLIPFIYLTARTSKQDVIHGYKDDIISYIKKPFDLEELYLMINNIIEFVNSFKIQLSTGDDQRKKIFNEFKKFIEVEDKEKKENRINSLCFKYRISPSEKRVLNLIFKDSLDKEISTQLNLAFDTVRAHVRNIRRKCGAKNKEELKKIFLK